MKTTARTIAICKPWAPTQESYNEWKAALDLLNNARTELERALTTIKAAQEHGKKSCAGAPQYLLQITALQCQMANDQAEIALCKLADASARITTTDGAAKVPTSQPREIENSVSVISLVDSENSQCA